MLMFVGKCKVDIPKIENREREQKGGGGGLLWNNHIVQSHYKFLLYLLRTKCCADPLKLLFVRHFLGSINVIEIWRVYLREKLHEFLC